MPKSGFDPQRHQRKHQRHNPLGNKKGSTASQPSSSSSSSAAVSGPASASTLKTLREQVGKGAAAATLGASPSEQLVPLLQNLPLPSTPAEKQASINAGDKVWSLASVSLLLSPQSGHTPAETKQNRKLLLSRDIVARLVYALQSDTNVEVRREASGALRNLCVDAGFDVRGEVANKGGVDAVLGAMRWAAHALGFDVDGTTSATAASGHRASTDGPNEMFVDTSPTLADELEKKRALLVKPINQMNKKEKRHATRLAAAMGKSLEQVAGQSLTAEDERVLLGGAASDGTAASGPSPSGARSEAFVSLDTETRKGLLEMSENLATISWCLCECGGNPFAKLITWRWIDQDLVGSGSAAELPGQGLAAWLCGSVALGCRAASVLSASNADGTRPSNCSDPIAALKNEELSLLLDLALASANALCGLTDGGESDFVEGLLGRSSGPRSGVGSGKKGSRPFKPVDMPSVESLDHQPEGASKRLSQIDRAIALLQACVQTNTSGLDKLKRYILSQTTMLGVLASGTLRNIAAAVDNSKSSTASATTGRRKKVAFTSNNIFVPSRTEGGEALTLKKYEEVHVLPALTQLLASVDCAALAQGLEGQGGIDEAETGAAGSDSSAEELQTKLQVRAEEKAQTLSLAIEVLAEMASGFDLARGGDDSAEWQEDLEAEEGSDAEMDEDIEVDGPDADAEDGDENGEPENDEKMADEDTFAEAVKRGGGIRFESIAPVLSGLVLPATGTAALADVLLPLARPFESSFPSLIRSTSSSHSNGTGSASSVEKQAPQLLRAMHVRSLSVLNNVLLRLASFSAPPASQPLTDPKELRRLAAFRTWLSSGGEARLVSIFQTLYEVARGCASVPAVADAAPALSASPASTNGVQASSGVTTASAASASAPAPANTEQHDGLLIVETCIGAMWSIARCLEGRVPLSWTNGVVLLPSSAGSADAELVSALIASYHTARSDGMKVKSISLLATIARSSAVNLDLCDRVLQFLLSVLEETSDRPAGGGGKTAASAGNAESVVAAINGLVDTFADETAGHDVVFRKEGTLKRCRATVFGCRAVVKSIDRRKFLSLRAIAEEAVENWTAFIEYRQGLKL